MIHSTFYRASKNRRERLLQRMKTMRDAKERRRLSLANMEPMRHPGKIVLRVIVIRNESTVKESIMFDTDSDRECRSKLRKAMQP